MSEHVPLVMAISDSVRRHVGRVVAPHLNERRFVRLRRLRRRLTGLFLHIAFDFGDLDFQVRHSSDQQIYLIVLLCRQSLLGNVLYPHQFLNVTLVSNLLLKFSFKFGLFNNQIYFFFLLNSDDFKL